MGPRVLRDRDGRGARRSALRRHAPGCDPVPGEPPPGRPHRHLRHRHRQDGARDQAPLRADARPEVRDLDGVVRELRRSVLGLVLGHEGRRPDHPGGRVRAGVPAAARSVHPGHRAAAAAHPGRLPGRPGTARPAGSRSSLADATTAPPESEETPALARTRAGECSRASSRSWATASSNTAPRSAAWSFGSRRDRGDRPRRFCKDQLGCDYLSFVAAIDWMPTPVIAEEGSGDTSAPVQPKEMTFGVGGSAGRLQVFAHVESTHQAASGITLKVDVDEADPHAESWVPVYPGADWHERETWEMFGIVFDGHPSLRHLYLPSEFEGHPLAQGLPAARARGEAVARSRGRRADARRRDSRRRDRGDRSGGRRRSAEGGASE